MNGDKIGGTQTRRKVWLQNPTSPPPPPFFKKLNYKLPFSLGLFL